MHDFTQQLEIELTALRARLSVALPFEHEYQDDLARFGDPTSDAVKERLRTRRHQEHFLLERPAESLGAVPLEHFFAGLDEREGEALASVYACLRASHVGVFLVKAVDERDGLLLEDLLGRGQYVIADPELAHVILQSDLLVGRLYPMDIENDGARTAWYASPAAMHIRHGRLLDALMRDLEAMRERTRGPLRMSQRDIEAMFFSAGLALSEPPSQPADPKVLRQKARDLLIGAGLPDMRVDDYLDALIDHPMPESDLALGGEDPLGWILNELAFQTDLELNHSRSVLAAYWRAVSLGDEGAQASSTPASEVGARPSKEETVGEARARKALAKFDAGREAGRDLDELFAELEADLGVELDDDDNLMSIPDVAPFDSEDFPGAVGALVQEFLWDAARLAQVPLDTFAHTQRDLELFVQFAAFLVNADELSKRHIELFLGRWIWEEGRLEKGNYSALGAVRATRLFCEWMSEHQDLELAKETDAFFAVIEGQAERLQDLGRRADARGATAKARRGFFEYVGYEDGETRWLEQKGGTFAGEVVGLDPLELLQSGDWVSGWRDDKRLGVIYVYPSIAGPYLKATS